MRKYYLLAIFMLPLALFAQPRLTIHDPVPTVPVDTLYYTAGDSVILYTVTMENTGNAKVDGPISIFFRYNSDTTSFKKIDTVVSNFEVGLIAVFTIRDTVRQNDARYDGGDNVLVIWPHSDYPGIQAPDSGNATIYITGLPAAVTPQALGERIEVWPNPVDHTLYIRHKKDISKIEYVRIIDLSGKVMLNLNAYSTQIPVESYPKGIYFLEVAYKDGLRGTFKLMVD